MSNCLENILMITSVAFAKDEISKAELVRVLGTLAGHARRYGRITDDEIAGEESREIIGMNVDWQLRFGHLMHDVPVGAETENGG